MSITWNSHIVYGNSSMIIMGVDLQYRYDTSDSKQKGYYQVYIKTLPIIWINKMNCKCHNNHCC